MNGELKDFVLRKQDEHTKNLALFKTFERIRYFGKNVFIIGGIDDPDDSDLSGPIEKVIHVAILLACLLLIGGKYWIIKALIVYALIHYILQKLGKYFIDTYGEVPEETEKEYTVSGLVCPLKSLNQIDDDSMKTLKKQAEDVYASYMGQNWDETSTLESLTYLGDYLLTDKNDSDGNILYLVYKAEIRSQYSDEEDGDTDTTDDIYWYISYSNVMLSDEGLQLDLVDYRTPGETTEVEGKGYNWSYYGYDSLDSLYKDVVTSNMDVYNHEDNVEDK